MKGLSIAGRKRNDGIDFYETPSWATLALLKREEFCGSVWEPACGEGAICKMLRYYYTNLDLLCTDIRKTEYGSESIDFLSSNYKYDNIITNPPFKYAKEFVLKAKQLTNKKVAMFLKLAFLESIDRYELFKDKIFPLKTVYVFCRRVQLYPEGIEKPKNSGTIAYAWYVWDKDYKGLPNIKWINDNPQPKE